jgi:hypothetical protein
MTEHLPSTAGAPPVLVAADAGAAQDAVARLRAAGWTVCGPADVHPDPWDLRDRALVVSVCVDDDAVPDVVLLAARGAGLVVVVDIDDPVIAETFVDQLHRIGPVHDAGAPSGTPTRRLTREEAAVLEALAGGASIPEAAAGLFLSVRTANRRLASARVALGVGSSRAAVVAHMATSARYLPRGGCSPS